MPKKMFKSFFVSCIIISFMTKVPNQWTGFYIIETSIMKELILIVILALISKYFSIQEFEKYLGLNILLALSYFNNFPTIPRVVRGVSKIQTSKMDRFATIVNGCT